jgi:hypothetical protein
MVLEGKKISVENKKQTFMINGLNFDINVDEFEDFLKHCSSFMDITKEGFELMIGSISDSIIDNQNVTMEEARPQLKFLREINFYLKSIYHNQQ